MFKLSYGLFVLSTRHNGKDNGCIINTVTQITDNPLRISVTVNKANLTHDMIMDSKEFNISVLTEDVPFAVFQKFGFFSGRDIDKFAGYDESKRTGNGIRFLAENTNVVISAKVAD
ncbi:MAG: flavin reductase family protein, partial [Firmicutes bacterium]|nr:flavin reductase family protein [Bacillota bacterium]